MDNHGDTPVPPTADGSLTFHILSGSGGSCGTSSEPKRHQLKLGDRDEAESFKVGRATKNELVFKHPGISWNHCELRVVSTGSDGVTSSQLVVRDLSTNGTGLQVPGGGVIRLEKDVDMPVPNGSLVVLPFKARAKEDTLPDSLRACFLVHLGELPAQALVPPTLPAIEGTPAGLPHGAIPLEPPTPLPSIQPTPPLLPTSVGEATLRPPLGGDMGNRAEHSVLGRQPPAASGLAVAPGAPLGPPLGLPPLGPPPLGPPPLGPPPLGPPPLGPPPGPPPLAAPPPAATPLLPVPQPLASATIAGTVGRPPAGRPPAGPPEVPPVFGSGILGSSSTPPAPATEDISKKEVSKKEARREGKKDRESAKETRGGEPVAKASKEEMRNEKKRKNRSRSRKRKRSPPRSLPSRSRSRSRKRQGKRQVSRTHSRRRSRSRRRDKAANRDRAKKRSRSRRHSGSRARRGKANESRAAQGHQGVVDELLASRSGPVPSFGTGAPPLLPTPTLSATPWMQQANKANNRFASMPSKDATLPLQHDKQDKPQQEKEQEEQYQPASQQAEDNESRRRQERRERPSRWSDQPPPAVRPLAAEKDVKQPMQLLNVLGDIMESKGAIPPTDGTDNKPQPPPVPSVPPLPPNKDDMKTQPGEASKKADDKPPPPELPAPPPPSTPAPEAEKSGKTQKAPQDPGKKPASEGATPAAAAATPAGVGATATGTPPMQSAMQQYMQYMAAANPSSLAAMQQMTMMQQQQQQHVALQQAAAARQAAMQQQQHVAMQQQAAMQQHAAMQRAAVAQAQAAAQQAQAAAASQQAAAQQAAQQQAAQNQAAQQQAAQQQAAQQQAAQQQAAQAAETQRTAIMNPMAAQKPLYPSNQVAMPLVPSQTMQQGMPGAGVGASHSQAEAMHKMQLSQWMQGLGTTEPKPEGSQQATGGMLASQPPMGQQQPPAMQQPQQQQQQQLQQQLQQQPPQRPPQQTAQQAPQQPPQPPQQRQPQPQTQPQPQQQRPATPMPGGTAPAPGFMTPPNMQADTPMAPWKIPGAQTPAPPPTSSAPPGMSPPAGPAPAGPPISIPRGASTPPSSPATDIRPAVGPGGFAPSMSGSVNVGMPGATTSTTSTAPAGVGPAMGPCSVLGNAGLPPTLAGALSMIGVSKSGSIARGPPPPASNTLVPAAMNFTTGMSKAAIQQAQASKDKNAASIPTGGVSKSAAAGASPPATSSTLRPDSAGGGLEDGVGGKASGKGSMASGDGGAGMGTPSWSNVADTGNAAVSKTAPALPAPRGGLPWKHSVDSCQSAAALMSTTDAKSAPWRTGEEVGMVVSPPKKSSAPSPVVREDWMTTTVPKSGRVDALAQSGRQGDALDGYMEVGVPSVNEQAISSVPPPVWTGGTKTEVLSTEKVAKAGATTKSQGADPPELQPQAKTLPWTAKAGSGGINDGWDKTTDMSKKRKAPPLPTPRGMRPAGTFLANSSPVQKEQTPEVATLPKAPRPSLPRPLGKGVMGSAAKVTEMDEPTSKAFPAGKGQAAFKNSKGKVASV